jgi:hypothetical protein
MAYVNENLFWIIMVENSKLRIIVSESHIEFQEYVSNGSVADNGLQADGRTLPVRLVFLFCKECLKI